MQVRKKFKDFQGPGMKSRDFQGLSRVFKTHTNPVNSIYCRSSQKLFPLCSVLTVRLVDLLCRTLFFGRILVVLESHRCSQEGGVHTPLHPPHTCQLSRFSRESPSFSSNLPVSRLSHQISRELPTVAFFQFFFSLISLFSRFQKRK